MPVKLPGFFPTSDLIVFPLAFPALLPPLPLDLDDFCADALLSELLNLLLGLGEALVDLALNWLPLPDFRLSLEPDSPDLPAPPDDDDGLGTGL